MTAIQFALQFERTDSVDRVCSEPSYNLIPMDTPPAVELACFFNELDRNHVDHHETERAGVYEVVFAGVQKWRVQVVAVGGDMDTQRIEAVS